jgi:hypothetical protein
VAAWIALPSIGCGGDEPASAPADAAKAAPKKKAATGRAAGRGKKDRVGGRLDTYVRIDERFRLPFSDRDFLSDAAGDDNRDPFRSFVVRQGNGPRELKGSSPIQPTDVCTEKNSKAPGYSVRDLHLIGLLLRGTSSYAQFRDPSGYGWIVRLRDCLGKEKAIIEKIGAGFETLEVLPESAAASNDAQAERRDIQLHPDELPAGESMTVEPPRETISPEGRPAENQP